MKWKYFYDHCYDWEEDKALKSVEALTDFGSAEELLECFSWLDEEPGKRLLYRALASGMVLQGENLRELDNFDIGEISFAIRDSLKKGVHLTLSDVLELLEYADDPTACLLIDEVLSEPGNLTWDVFLKLEEATWNAPLAHLVTRFLEKGFSFTPEQLEEVGFGLGPELVSRAALQSESVFTESNIKNLGKLLDAQTAAELRKKSKKKQSWFERRRDVKKQAAERQQGFVPVFFDERREPAPRFRNGDRVSFMGDIFDTVDLGGMYLEGVVVDTRNGYCRIRVAETSETFWVPEDKLKKIGWL